MRRGLRLAGLLGLALAAACAEREEPALPPVVQALGPEALAARDTESGDLLARPLEARGDFERLEIEPGSEAAWRHLAGGFSRAEEHEGRRWMWSSGPVSTLRFALDAPRPLRLELEAAPFQPPDAVPQAIEVRVGDAVVGVLPVAPGRQVLVQPLPAEHLRAGDNEVALYYAWTAAPRDVVPGSDDGRELAVRFDAIRLVAEAGTRLAPPSRVQVGWPSTGTSREGFRQTTDGSFSLLAWPPAPARLELETLLLPGMEPGRPVALRVALEWDDGRRELLSLDASATGRPERHVLELGLDASRAVRLRFEAKGLVAGAQAFWLAPRLVSSSAVGEAAPTAPRLPEGTNVVILLLDAAARDHFGFYGYERDTTPNLDRLAEESLIFDAALAQASYTLASMPTLFASVSPAEHGVLEERDRLSEDYDTLAERLRDAGYETALFAGNPYLSERWGLTQGFDRVDALWLRDGEKHLAKAEEFFDPAVSWMRERQGPFFAFLHYVQPHEPYDAGAPEHYHELDPAYRGAITGEQEQMRRVFRGELALDDADVAHLRALYDGNLRYADAAVGRVVDALDEAGLLDRTLLVVTSDHGESLGERGTFGHGHTVDAELLDLPLLVRFPPAMDLRGRSAAQVGSIDVLPTILAGLGLPLPDHARGRNLLAPEPGPRSLLAVAGGRNGIWSALAPGFKYVGGPAMPTRRLLPLPAHEDGEDLRERHPVTFDYLEAEAARLAGAPSSEADTSAQPIERETREALEALGYGE